MNFVRSPIGADRSDCWMSCALSQLRWNGHPQMPPTFSRSPRGCSHNARNGLWCVSLRVVQMAFFSNNFRGSEHALRRAFRPSALRTSNSVQPPSCSTSKPVLDRRVLIWRVIYDFVVKKKKWLCLILGMKSFRQRTWWMSPYV